MTQPDSVRARSFFEPRLIDTAFALGATATLLEGKIQVDSVVLNPGVEMAISKCSADTHLAPTKSRLWLVHTLQHVDSDAESTVRALIGGNDGTPPELKDTLDPVFKTLSLVKVGSS